MKKNVTFLIAIIFLGYGTLAISNPSKCSSSLSRPFNFNQFKKCQALIKKACPPKPVVPDFKCTQPLLKQNRICHQSQELVNLVMGDIYTLQATKAHNFFIINNYTIADGKNNYYIITPQGCVFNTVIDVRQYDATLKKKYNAADFLTLNHGKPQVIINKNQTVSIIAPLKINNTCVACATIGYASVGFYFTKTGELNSIKVLNFTSVN